MEEFKLMARLLAAVRAGEEAPVFNMALVSEPALRATADERDRMALKLQEAGYIDGLFLIDGVDNMPRPLIKWEASSPAITLAGLEYIDKSNPLRKALREIVQTSVPIAAQLIANSASKLL